jgi:predicted nucleic acid-binding protein
VSDPFFDTNILIDWLKDIPEAKAELRSYPRHRMSRVVWTEILAGEEPAHRDQTSDLLDAFDIVEVDRRVATVAADIRHSTRMKLLDAFILATARVNGAVLITRNIRDFPADMPGIRVPYTR